MRKTALLLAVSFSVTLAAVIGTRMSAEALAVVIGVVCGVAAGIPVCLLLLTVTSRREQAYVEPGYPRQSSARYEGMPPVVVIQGGTPSASNYLPPYYQPSQPMFESSPRQFHVVGELED